MPVAQIALIPSVKERSSIDLIGLIDSGSDATMLPIDTLESAGARYVQSRQMRGVTGQSVSVDTYLIAVSVGPYIVQGIQAVALPAGSEAILGRDVLNQLEIVLNGPAQELWVS